VLYFVTLGPDNQASKVVFMAKLMADGKTNYYNFRTILGNAQVIPYLRNYGERIYVDTQEYLKSATGEMVPVAVVHPTDGSPGGTIDSTGVFKFFTGNKGKEFTAEEYETIAKTINNPNFTSNDLQAFKMSLDLFMQYLDGEEKFKINAPNIAYLNTGRTDAVVKEHNGKLGHQFEYITSDINKTNFMETPTDLFFIEIPEYERMRSYDTSIMAMLPKLKDIAKPYPHPIYNTPYYKNVFNQSTAQRRETLQKVNELYKLTDQEMTDVPRIDFKLVEGYVENNDLDIQENENEFRNALVEYIKYDIKQTYPNGDVDKLFSESTCSPRLLEFLNELLERVLRLNWSHTNKIPLGYVDEDDDDDDNIDLDRSEDAFESATFLDVGEQVINGMLVLNGFIDKAAKSGLGLMAHVESIIKLSRWGDCKPTVLKIGEFKQFFDLNNFLIKNTTGNLMSLTKALVEGYELDLRGVIMFDDKFRDADYRLKLGVENSKIDIPIGLVCERHYTNGVRQIVYLSFIELINEYRNNTDLKLVKGINYTDAGGFVINVPPTIAESYVPLRLAQESVASSPDKMFIFYETDVTKALTLEFSCGNLSNLGILFEYLYSQNNMMSKWSEMLSFTTKQELAQKMADNSLPRELYLKTNIAELLLPIVLKSSASYDDRTDPFVSEAEKLTFVINTYVTVMNQLGFVNEGQKWNGQVRTDVPAPTPQSAPAEVGQKLNQMSAFAAQQNQQSGATTTATSPQPTNPAGAAVTAVIEPINNPIVPLTEDDKLLSITENGQVIGCFTVKTIEGKKLYVLEDPTKAKAAIAHSSNVVDVLLPLLFDLLGGLINNNVAATQARFASTDAIKYYRVFFGDRWKKMNVKK
jgi:hypothetical protein